MIRVKLSILAVVCAAGLTGAAADGPRFQRAYALAPSEGVFAYSRISPDGRLLVYASETPTRPGRPPAQTITVVQLASGQVLFTEPGIDAYWSNDGRRMVYLSYAAMGGVAIRHHDTGRIARDVAPSQLGDYFSWAVRDGRDMILTIRGNYYYLDGDRGIMPHERVPSCAGIGTGERPLISKDGRRITTFVRGNVVVRDLDACDSVLDTGLKGAKADFSWDGRYIAFHAPKPTLKGYDLQVVDTQKRTVRTITSALPGSSLFPSWTKDGRLSFRYDGDDYRGFMFADRVLDAPERPLPATPAALPARPRWAELFPETPPPAHRVALVMIWAPWSAHSPQALTDLQRAAEHFETQGTDAAVATALAVGSAADDVTRIRRANDISVPAISLAPRRFATTEAVNQIPTTLLFRDGVMVDRRLGAQRFDDLVAWVSEALGVAPR